MTLVQWMVRVSGWIFILLALFGFTAAGGSWAADPAMAPRLFGLFPVNVVHNAVHLVFGLWAMFAYHDPYRAKGYAVVTGIAYALLAALGLLAPSFFGLVPIGGPNVGLHAVIGVALVAAGFTARGAPPGPPGDPV